MTTGDYSLREIKHTRTKIALTSAFIERLRKSRFEDISIKDVCKGAEISEGTFFNYFPEKTDIVTYYIRLLMTKIIWKARKKAPQGRHIALINAFFEEIANEFSKIDISYELISIMVALHKKPGKTVLSKIEKKLFFPDLSGIGDSASLSIDEFFQECIADAQKNGELPGTVHINNALVSLHTIMVGTMLAIKFRNIKNIKYQYARQLQILWKELGVKQQKG